MMEVQYIKPFYSKNDDGKIRLVFAYQYLSILKDGKIFMYVPTEGKEIIVDEKTGDIINLNDVFVFQHGNQFLRLPLKQLCNLSDIKKRIDEIVDPIIREVNSPYPLLESNYNVVNEKNDGDDSSMDTYVDTFLVEMEIHNIKVEIDRALDERNEERFYQLTSRLKELTDKLDNRDT